MSSEWPMVKLGDVLTRSNELIPIAPDKCYQQITVKLWGKGVVQRAELLGSEIAAPRQYIVKPHQFILSRIDARNGAFGLIPGSLDGAVVSNDFPVFDLNREVILPEFLEWMSKTHWFVDLCKQASEGTTNRIRLKEETFLAAEIPLPPLDEQRRIVARIDTLAERIAEARGLRAEAVEEVVLLLSSCMNRFLSSGRHDWRWVILDEIAEVQAGVTLGRTLAGETISVPYLRVANVQAGYLALEQIKEISIYPNELTKWTLQENDILLTEGGDWDKLGRGTIWKNEIPDCIHQNHIFRLRCTSDKINPNYLIALINSSYGKSYFQAASKQTTNLASINQRQLKSFRVPLPPLDEQRHIMAYLDALQAKVDAVKALQAETAAELDALLPSVVDKAFRGEL